MVREGPLVNRELTQKHLPEAFMLAFVDEVLFLGTAGGFIWACSLMNSYGRWLSLAVKSQKLLSRYHCANRAPFLTHFSQQQEIHACSYLST